MSLSWDSFQLASLFVCYKTCIPCLLAQGPFAGLSLFERQLLVVLLYRHVIDLVEVQLYMGLSLVLQLHNPYASGVQRMSFDVEVERQMKFDLEVERQMTIDLKVERHMTFGHEFQDTMVGHEFQDMMAGLEVQQSMVEGYLDEARF